MQLINSISNGIGRAVDWTVDSSWGLGYWHSIPSSLWDSRIRQLITSLFIAGSAASLIAQTDPNNPSEIVVEVMKASQAIHNQIAKSIPSLRPLPSNEFKSEQIPLPVVFFLLSTLNWLSETKFLSAPLTGSLLKTILANSAVTTLDSFFMARFFKTWEEPNRTRSCLSAAWLLYRFADITLTWGNASDGLVRLNFDPTLGLARRLAFWSS